MSSMLGEGKGRSKEVEKNAPPKSLLDILISSEEPTDEPDPLDGFGNIGDTVIGQLSGAMGFGQDLMQGALKMFEEANDYSRSFSSPQKRRNNRFDVLRNDVKSSSSSTTFGEPRAKKKFHQSVEECSRQITADEYLINRKVENERKQQNDHKVDKEIERLLQTVTKVYGPKDWSEAEKIEFSKYCNILRSGKFTEEEKVNLHNFYAKAYYEQYQKDLGNHGPVSEDVVKEMLGSKSAICYPAKSGLFQTESNNSQKQDDVFQMEVKSKEPYPTSISNSFDPAAFLIVDPALKYGKEKEFRRTINNMFNCAIRNPSHSQESPNTKQGDVGKIEELIGKLNHFMGEEKEWDQDDVQHLLKYYNDFKEKFHLTIVQTKEFGSFIRKIYGKLEKHEIERENDVELQEKRKYWQEYGKAKSDSNKVAEQIPASSVRSYVKTNVLTREETLEDRKLRKAAYLRQWRLAQKEKQMNLNAVTLLPGISSFNNHSS